MTDITAGSILSDFLHDILDDFEEAWNSYTTAWVNIDPPKIEDYFELVTDHSDNEKILLLKSLIGIDAEYRNCQEHPSALREYVSRFPKYTDIIHAIFVDVPDKVGKYSLNKLIGKGSFGRVYSARNPDTDTIIAIKIQNRVSRAKSQWKELSEQILWHKLHHSNIVQFYEASYDEIVGPFLVLQYISGKSLKEDLAQRKIYQPHAASAIIAKIASAIYYAHSKNIIHRDLNPGNILVSEDGTPHITDFGLASHIFSLPWHGGEFAGTLYYSAPEQLDGKPLEQSDIWSIGVIFYEMLTGRRPFEGTTNKILSSKIKNKTPIIPSKIRTGIPKELDEIILKCLRKDPADRFQSAGDLVQELENWLKSVDRTLLTLDFSPFIDEKRRHFVGRSWLFGEVERWQVLQNESILLITGDQGTGKSAFAAEFVHRYLNDQVLAYHFCQFDTPDTLQPASFVRSLAGMLCKNCEGYQQAMSDHTVREALTRANCESDSLSAFDRGILTPLHRLASPPENIRYIVIDSLDEALDVKGSGNTIVDLLSSPKKRMPKWLRILATTRKDSEVLRRLSGERQIFIDGNDEDGNQDRKHLDDIREDLRQFIAIRLSEPYLSKRLHQAQISAQDAAAVLLEKSELNFLYVAEALTGVERDLYTFQQLDQLPPGLHSLYEGFFRRRWPDQRNFASVRPVLETLVAAQEPVSKELLVAATTGMNVYELAECLDHLAQYLDQRQNRVRLRNLSIREWLTQTKGTYCIIPKEGHKRLAKACWEELQNYKAGDRELTSFCVKHLSHHLTESKRWNELATVLTDLLFLQAKIEKGYLFSLIHDCKKAVEDLPSKNTSRNALREIADILTCHAAFLDDNQDHLFQCLYNDTISAFEDSNSDITHSSGSLRSLTEKWRADGAPGHPWARMIVRPKSSSVPVLRFHSHPITAIAVLKPGNDLRELVVSCDWAGVIALWEATGRLLDQYLLPYNPHVVEKKPGVIAIRSRHYCCCAKWGQSVRMLVTGNTNGNVYPWQVAHDRLEIGNAAKPLHSFFNIDGTSSVPVQDVAISKNALLCASIASHCNQVYVAHVSPHKNINVQLPDENDICACITFCPQRDDLLVVGTVKGLLRILWLSEEHLRQNGAMWGQKVDLGVAIRCIACSGDGRRIFALTSNWTLHVYDIRPDGHLESVITFSSSCNASPAQIAADQKGLCCAVVSEAGDLSIIPTKLQQGPVGSVFRELNATCVGSSNIYEGSFYVGTKSGEILIIKSGDSTTVTPETTWVALSQDGNILGVASADDVIEFRSTSTGSIIHCLRDHLLQVTAGCFYDSDQLVALLTESGEILTCDPRGQEAIHRWKAVEIGRAVCINGARRAPLLGIAKSIGILSVWLTSPHPVFLGSCSLFWKPSCIAWNDNGELIAVGGKDAQVYRVSDEGLVRHGIGIIKWLKDYRPDLLRNSPLDEACCSEDGIDMKPLGEYTTNRLGVSSIALSGDGEHLAIGFRSNTLAVLPVMALTGTLEPVEILVVSPPDPTEPRFNVGTRWIVDLKFALDGRRLAIRQSNGMVWIVELATNEWRQVGRCAALGDWVFQTNYGLFDKEPKAYTEVRRLDTGLPLMYYPDSLELLGEGAEQNKLVVHLRNKCVAMVAIERA